MPLLEINHSIRIAKIVVEIRLGILSINALAGLWVLGLVLTMNAGFSRTWDIRFFIWFVSALALKPLYGPVLLAWRTYGS